MMSVYLLILFLYFGFVYSGSLFIDGPAQVKFNWIRDCPNAKNVPIKFHTRIHKVNRTIQVLDVNVSLPFPFDQTVSGVMSSERWGAGGWMKNAFNMKESNLCFMLNNVIGDLWFDIQKRIGMPPGKCPLPRGNYYAKDTVIDLQRMTVQTFMNGKFKTLVKIYKSQKLVMCTEFELELSEKLSYV